VWDFNINNVKGRYTGHPRIAQFIRRVAVRTLLASEEHSKLFKIYTPAERYHYVEQHNPQLLQRISLSQIASYLGVARETLSRIRAKKTW
jgi:CRP-like cAMP-binding protein